MTNRNLERRINDEKIGLGIAILLLAIVISLSSSGMGLLTIGASSYESMFRSLANKYTSATRSVPNWQTQA